MSLDNNSASQNPHGGVFGESAPLVEIAAHNAAHHLLEEGKEHQAMAKIYSEHGNHLAAAEEQALSTAKTAGAIGGMTVIGSLSGWAGWIVATGGWATVVIVGLGVVVVSAELIQAATQKSDDDQPAA
ncbi:MAG: hypothetical protein EAZ74_01115 [Alphaproteobacteria bacterium]|nr:MAG: hypothetical protein EAZ74_01115 [Alphaproteobacteria bacterium]TAF77000.1 MAG: hypothetical protein EAZ52_02445 [Alphaproteobacteria bacterium]